VYRQIRANLGWPGAFSFLPNGDGLKVHAAKLCSEENVSGNAGEVVIGEHLKLYVCCERGAIELTQVQRAGRSKTSAIDFIHGNNIGAGQTLGAK
jgi:methionyl-tRNA formyltransferase